MSHRSLIAPGLWQGPEPERPVCPEPVGDIGLLVLCYLQHGEPWERFAGRDFLVHEAPMDDDQRTLRPHDIPIAHEAATVVAAAMRTGRVTLVTCHQGMNRSGLVSALALRFVHDLTGAEALARVRAARPGAVYNEAFAEHVRALGRP